MNGNNERGDARLCIVLAISNLEFGGAQRQVVELANCMNAGRFDVHVVSLSTYVPLGSELAEADRRLHVVGKRFKFDASLVWRLARLLKNLRADVVQGYLFDAQIATRLAGRLAGTPLVVGSERNADYTLKWRQKAAFRMTRACVDLIVANSGAGAAFNRRMLGHSEEQYRVVHNGVNASRFHPADGAAMRAELGIAPDERLIGMFGSYKRQKNHPLFLAAGQRVLREFPRARLMIVGDELHAGKGKSDLTRARVEQLANELGIASRCLFIGNRLDPERLYPACDVTVLPSFFEGTPNVLLESMACGVPVVTTDVSDHRYIVPDGRVGFVVPLGDEGLLARRLCEMLGDDARRAEMGRAARAWIEQEFSTARLAEKTAAVFEEGLARKVARSPASQAARA